MNYTFAFSNIKNKKIIEKHNISFQEVINAIQSGDLIVIVNNPNEREYPNEKAFIVWVKKYVYVVPFIIKEENIELKTAFPSRKAMKKYGV